MLRSQPEEVTPELDPHGKAGAEPVKGFLGRAAVSEETMPRVRGCKWSRTAGPFSTPGSCLAPQVRPGLHTHSRRPAPCTLCPAPVAPSGPSSALRIPVPGFSHLRHLSLPRPGPPTCWGCLISSHWSLWGCLPSPRAGSVPTAQPTKTQWARPLRSGPVWGP